MSKPFTLCYEFGGFRLDAANRLLFHDDELVPLTSKSIEILLVLLESEGNVVEKNELMSRVWPDSFVEEANLAHHVYLLRKALGDDNNGTRFIQTIPRRGYRFVAEVKKTVNGVHIHRADVSQTKLLSSQELNRSLQAHNSGSPQLPVDILPISKPFNGDMDNSVETSAGSTERLDIASNVGPPSVASPPAPGPVDGSLAFTPLPTDLQERERELLSNLTDSQTPSLVDQTAQLGGTSPGRENESWIRARMPLRAVSRRLWASGVTAVALLAGIVWFKSAHDRTALEEGSRVKTSPFTSLAGMENQPTFSPDGNQVAFCWNGEKEDNLDIYVKLIGTDSMLRLTTHPAQDTSPAWSPDGRFIAFRRNTGKESGFYLVPALGGVERKVAAAFPARAHFRGLSVDWTPDGRFLVVVDRESEETPFNISVLSVETGKKRRLVSPSAPSTGVMALAVSPDGQLVAFSQITSRRTDLARTQNDLYTVSIMGGEPKRLTFDSSWVSGMSWSPDGSGIVFASQRGESSGLIAPLSLWRIPVSGGQPERLSVASQYGRYPSNPMISRNGSRLVCEQRDIWSSDIWKASGPRASGDASLPAKFIASTWPESNAQFSPDGKRIAYRGGGSGNHEIWVCDEQGQGCAQLTSMAPRIAQNPRWSPDGSEIAFDASDGIYVVRSDGGSARALAVENSTGVLPSWSRDGQWLYYGSNRGGTWQVWKSPAAGGQPVQVTQHGGFEAFESLDGRFLYYTKPIGLMWTFGLSSIWRMPVAGGEETRVVERTSAGYWGLLNDGLCYLDPSGDLPFSIQYLNFATGRKTKVGSIDKEPIWNYSSFAVSPDGRWILYTKRPSEERDLMLVENFH